jgi:hypothetical protein
MQDQATLHLRAFAVNLLWDIMLDNYTAFEGEGGSGYKSPQLTTIIVLRRHLRTFEPHSYIRNSAPYNPPKSIILMF